MVPAGRRTGPEKINERGRLGPGRTLKSLQTGHRNPLTSVGGLIISRAVEIGVQASCLSQDSKKRLFGSFSVHISTKEVSPFHGRYSTKMTDVFFDGRSGT
jgi:hypothetical protein